MRKTLTDKGVTALKPRPQRYAYPDPELRGHFVRVQPSGAKSFVVVSRDPYGKQIWATIGSSEVLKIDDARDSARNAIKRIREGKPPVEPAPVRPDTFKDVADSWLARVVAANKMRTEAEIRRTLEKYVYPKWADRDFISIKRSDISALLDHIEDHHGSRMADVALSKVRSVANWYASRDDDYVSPFVRGMKRHKKPARSRILDDAELEAIWKQAEVDGKFGAFMRLLLLTAQRVDKVLTMRWADIVDGTWIIATAEREKTNAGSLALPPLALQIIAAQPRIGNNPFVFAGRANGCMDISKSKPRFDAQLPVIPGWTLHDLRRTARSLLSRAGVRPDIAERVLGHTIGGVEGIYDRHQYDREKADALRRLATLIDGIVNPRQNVTPLRKRAKRT